MHYSNGGENLRNQLSFYQDFYGHKFFRHFRRPPESCIREFKIQFTVTNPKQLYSHVKRNNGFHPCYTHIYDYGLLGNLKRKQPVKMIIDRCFFDFDISHPEIHEIKKQIHINRINKVKYWDLQEKLQDLIIDEHIIEPAILEAKDFADKFCECFNNRPLLFFSGCKGAHAYTFFEPIQEVDVNRIISYFAGNIKEVYQYKTLDLAVNQDPISRLSRVPYSKHEYSGLTVVPFTVEETYEEIMEKSLHPQVESFKMEDYQSTLGEHLETIWPLVKYNEELIALDRKAKQISRFINYPNHLKDHREWFKEILGPPVREYPEKEYVMYNCPFTDHDDNKPSFKVNKYGYYCYGCERRGNYYQFLKEHSKESIKTDKEYNKR